MSDSPLFLLEDLSSFRVKITGLDGHWRRRWEIFLATARREKRSVRWYGSKSTDTPMHAGLAWLATGERDFAEIARRDLVWMLDRHGETLAVGAQDHDTWIYAAALARRAIALDWLWDAEVLEEDERERLADFFVAEALRYSWIVLQHRVPAHATNQGLALALHCVITGYLFGVKRGCDLRARHLLAFALPHIVQQIALLPPGGYSGEGSTYLFRVADPLMAVACATLEAISGDEWYSRELWPNRNSAATVLELGPKLIPPSGLLPAWDQHGYHLVKAGAACAYVAHRTGDRSVYQHFSDGPGWEFSGHFAWLRDDHVWQWIWMPTPEAAEESDGQAGCYPASWAESRVAGALLDRTRALHLFQMWDVSSRRPVRLHLNPNSLLLEAWGSVLTVDGNATDDFPLNSDPRMQYIHQYGPQPKTLSWAAGSLAAHSVLWIDDAIDHQVDGGGYENLPGETPTGFLLRREEEDDFQLIATEVAMFYRNRHDVRSMIRNSALIGDAFWMILDQVASDTPHAYSWQLVLRAGADATSYGARLVTPEHVVLDVVNLDSVDTQLHDVEGYPSLLEGRCHHLRKTQVGANVEFLTVLIPQLGRRELADWTTDWRGGWRPSDETALPNEDTLQPVKMSDTYGGPSGSSFWLQRTCALPPVPTGTPLLLELPRPHDVRVWIDGVEIPVPAAGLSKDGEQRLLPAFVEVPADFAARDHVEIVLRIDPATAVGLTGSVKLHEKIPVEIPRVEAISDGLVRVRFGEVDHTVSLARLHTASTPLPTQVPEGENPLKLGQQLARKLLPTPPPREFAWHSDDPAERGQACIAAATRPVEEVEDRLREACDDADWSVRLLAIDTVGSLRIPSMVPTLCRILREETAERINRVDYAPRYRIKEKCVIALGEIGDVAAVDALVEAMEQAGFYGVRRLVPGALEKLGDAAAISKLEKWKDDSDGETADACRRAGAAILAYRQ